MIDQLEQLDVDQLPSDVANALWARVRRQTVCFDDFSRDNAHLFAERLAAPSTVAFYYKDSALITIEGLVPKLLGNIHFFVWDPKILENEIVDVGRAIVSDVMERYDLHRISAFPPAFNKLALRVAVRCGFKYEGTIRQTFLQNGIYHDVMAYGLLRHEFRERGAR